MSERIGRTKMNAMRFQIVALAFAGALAGPGALAQTAPTPAQPRGPFYPRTLPAENDTDLTQYQGKRAQGQVLNLAGRVLDRQGRPVAGARVEIWQTNAGGRYHHEGDKSPAPIDPGFQGWGRTTTGPDGAYAFRTVRPAAYSGRAPHIHFAVTAPDRRTFYTQLYFADAAENRADFLVSDLSAAERERLMAKIEPGSEGARFDIVLP